MMIEVTGIFCLIVLCLYVFAILPRMIRRADRRPFLGRYYAHRGLHDGSAGIPENSLAAFRRAVEEGYGIELDVRLTKDGRAVVFHDDTLLRMCGMDVRVDALTYEELKGLFLAGTGEHIPLFSDVLRLVNGSVPLIVELKLVDLSVRVCEVADRELSGYRGAYCIESFHPLAVRWYRLHRREVLRGQLSSNFKGEGEKENIVKFLAHHLLFNFLGRPDFIAYSHRFAGVLERRLCRRPFGALSVAWTIRSKEELALAESRFDLFIFEGFRPDRQGL